MESALCASGTCLEASLNGRSATTCLEAQAEEGQQFCHTTTCTDGGASGCDITVELGEAVIDSDVDGDSAHVVTYTIPVTKYEMAGGLLYGDSNCLLSTEVVATDPPTVTVTIETDTLATCGGEEEVTRRVVNIDLDPLVFHVEEGEGISNLCSVVELAIAENGFQNAEQFRAAFEPFVLDALGDLDAFVTVGTSCGGSCSGDCQGLSCAAPAAVD